MAVPNPLDRRLELEACCQGVTDSRGGGGGGGSPPFQVQAC